MCQDHQVDVLARDARGLEIGHQPPGCRGHVTGPCVDENQGLVGPDQKAGIRADILLPLRGIDAVPAEYRRQLLFRRVGEKQLGRMRVGKAAIAHDRALECPDVEVMILQIHRRHLPDPFSSRFPGFVPVLSVFIRFHLCLSVFST